MTLIERRDATQRTVARFSGQPFEWGKYDCGQMMIFHLRQMGWKFSTGGTWTSPVGVRRFLSRHGGASGGDLLDGLGLPRIAPAAMILGDIVELEGEPPFGAFGVFIGNGRLLAYHEEAEGAVVMQPHSYLCAWRA